MKSIHRIPISTASFEEQNWFPDDGGTSSPLMWARGYSHPPVSWSRGFKAVGTPRAKIIASDDYERESPLRFPSRLKFTSKTVQVTSRGL
jgi:hypothetical protein